MLSFGKSKYEPAHLLAVGILVVNVSCMAAAEWTAIVYTRFLLQHVRVRVFINEEFICFHGTNYSVFPNHGWLMSDWGLFYRHAICNNTTCPSFICFILSKSDALFTSFYAPSHSYCLLFPHSLRPSFFLFCFHKVYNFFRIIYEFGGR